MSKQLTDGFGRAVKPDGMAVGTCLSCKVNSIFSVSFQGNACRLNAIYVVFGGGRLFICQRNSCLLSILHHGPPLVFKRLKRPHAVCPGVPSTRCRIERSLFFSSIGRLSIAGEANRPRIDCFQRFSGKPARRSCPAWLRSNSSGSLSLSLSVSLSLSLCVCVVHS